MSKSQRSALIVTFTGLMSLLLFAVVGLSQTPPSAIELTTNPPVGQFYPFEAEAKTPQSPTLLTLTARNPAGELLTNSLFKIQIFTPPHTPFLSTDFPVAEGTKLLELNAIATNTAPLNNNRTFAGAISPLWGKGCLPITQPPPIPTANKTASKIK